MCGEQPKNIKDDLAAAARSQRKDVGDVFKANQDAVDGRVSCEHLPGEEEIDQWLEDLRLRVDGEGRRVANQEQFEAVRVVAGRLKDELRAVASGNMDFGEPLRWIIHGGPGTGKSHVLRLLKELFTTVMRWEQDTQFIMVALQAVMADLLGGDTIHHALGIPIFDQGRNEEQMQAREAAVARKVLQLRWLIIDEFSMVSARLFAAIDLKLRQVIRDVAPGKLKNDYAARTFGGI